MSTTSTEIRSLSVVEQIAALKAVESLIPDTQWTSLVNHGKNWSRCKDAAISAVLDNDNNKLDKAIIGLTEAYGLSNIYRELVRLDIIKFVNGTSAIDVKAYNALAEGAANSLASELKPEEDGIGSRYNTYRDNEAGNDSLRQSNDLAFLLDVGGKSAWSRAFALGGKYYCRTGLLNKDWISCDINYLISTALGCTGKYAKKLLPALLPTVQASTIAWGKPEFYIEQGSLVWNKASFEKLNPVEGSFDNIEKVLLNLVDGNRDYYEYVNSWLAAPIQDLYNGKAPQRNLTALLFKGPEGAGKGTLEQIIRAILGDKENTVMSADNDSLVSKFNGGIDEQLFICFNEIFPEGVNGANSQNDKVHSKLKVYITDPVVKIEGKGKQARDGKMQANILLFTNKQVPLSLKDSDRRYSIFETGAILKPELSEKVYGDLRGARKELRAYLYHLLNNVQPIKQGLLCKTEAKSEMVAAVRSPVELFIEEIAERGIDILMEEWSARAARGNVNNIQSLFSEVNGQERAVDFISTTNLSILFSEWVEVSGYRSRMNVNQLAIAMEKAGYEKMRLGKAYGQARGFTIPFAPKGEPTIEPKAIFDGFSGNLS